MGENRGPCPGRGGGGDLAGPAAASRLQSRGKVYARPAHALLRPLLVADARAFRFLQLFAPVLPQFA